MDGLATAVSPDGATVAVAPGQLTAVTAASLDGTAGAGQPAVADPGDLADRAEQRHWQPKVGDGMVTDTHAAAASADGDEFALLTAGGGALVFYADAAQLTITRPAGSAIRLTVPGFYSPAQTRSQAGLTYLEQFAAYDPPAGGGAPRVVAEYSGITGKRLSRKAGRLSELAVKADANPPMPPPAMTAFMCSSPSGRVCCRRSGPFGNTRHSHGLGVGNYTIDDVVAIASEIAANAVNTSTKDQAVALALFTHARNVLVMCFDEVDGQAGNAVADHRKPVTSMPALSVHPCPRRVALSTNGRHDERGGSGGNPKHPGRCPGPTSRFPR